MPTNYLVKIYNTSTSKWIRLPMPSTDGYNGTVATQVNTSSNANGQILIDVVVSGVAKVEINFSYLSKEQWSTILKLFEPDSLYSNYGGSFTNYVKFYDQVSNSFICREMYVNDRKAGLISLDKSGNIRGWKECSLNLIDTRNNSFTTPTDTESGSSSNNYTINADGTLEKVV